MMLHAHRLWMPLPGGPDLDACAPDPFSPPKIDALVFRATREAPTGARLAGVKRTRAQRALDPDDACFDDVDSDDVDAAGSSSPRAPGATGPAPALE